ncbi:MAG TPA: hypothetical protein PLJ29_19965, partial [Leptospiraceae bacterium]|nr:hypothetical protein [Leptospiraceae bacterium]
MNLNFYKKNFGKIKISLTVMIFSAVGCTKKANDNSDKIPWLLAAASLQKSASTSTSTASTYSVGGTITGLSSA